MASHLQGGMVGLQDRPVLLARALQQSCGQTKGYRIHFPVQAKGTRGLTSSIQKQGGWCWWGGPRLQRERKIRKTKAPYMESWLLLF